MDCFFCEHLEDDQTFLSSNYFVSRFDDFGVSQGHCEVIPLRHVSRFSEMTLEEKAAFWSHVEQTKVILEERFSPDGFNYGWNEGVAAGQSIGHLHFHVIPRYTGDIENPRGGVRNILPGGDYSDRAKAMGRGKYLNDK